MALIEFNGPEVDPEVKEIAKKVAVGILITGAVVTWLAALLVSIYLLTLGGLSLVFGLLLFTLVMGILVGLFMWSNS